MKYTHLIIACIVTLVASSCSADTRLSLDHVFSPEEVSWVMQAGKSTVKGHAYIRLENDQYRGCQGFSMELLPATAYSNERILKTYGNNKSAQILISENPPKFTPDPKAYHELSLKTKCTEGHVFQFNDVPEGEYYLMAFIFWANPSQSDLIEGGAVMQHPDR